MSAFTEKYVKEFMGELIAKNPGESEFHQAVKEVLEADDAALELARAREQRIGVVAGSVVADGVALVDKTCREMVS